ncbi:hypothetical protein YGH007_12380 [Helicobacter pylori]
MKKSKKSKQPLIASLASLAGFAVKISPGLLSLLGLMLAMGCASFWIQKPICARFMNRAR